MRVQVPVNNVHGVQICLNGRQTDRQIGEEGKAGRIKINKQSFDNL